MIKLFSLFTRLLMLLMFALCCLPDLTYAAAGGVRPVSLGGVFVAIADDVNAATWNPAGLGWQQDKELSYSGIFSKRGEYIPGDFISDDYLLYAQPLRVNYRGDFDELGGFGLYFLNSGYEDNITRAKQTIRQPGIAYGRAFSSNEAMAWGVSANLYMYDSEIPGAVSSDNALGVNAGYLWYLNSSITLGLLIENINEPALSLYGVTSRIVRIWRPAIACYFSDSTVFSLEVYDLTGNTKDSGSDYSRNIRLGFEHYLTEEVSLRMGAHNINSEVDTSKYVSLGIGFMRSDFFNLKQINYYLDYAFIYWTDAINSMDDYTHQVGLSMKISQLIQRGWTNFTPYTNSP
ncbi:MAG: hypothetical protein L6416_11665 [Candidatus Omnitrophica bacterium]|nr:hypothetical protein [Candidatus Omnitrophota bacterium]